MTSIDAIQRATCKVFGVSMLELVSERRHRGIVAPRWVAMYLAREMTGQTLTVIGKAFNKDHTSVVNALREIEADKARFAAKIEAVRAEITEAHPAAAMVVNARFTVPLKRNVWVIDGDKIRPARMGDARHRRGDDHRVKTVGW